MDRRDLLQRYGPASPIEGVWELRRMVGAGSTIGGPTAGIGSSGYLMIGRRHLSLQLYAPSRRGGSPRIQTSFRNYTLRGNQLVMTSKIGFGNEADGDIVLSRPGSREARRFEYRGGFLRIFRAGGGMLEFVRIE